VSSFTSWLKEAGLFETRRVYKTYEQIVRQIREAISSGALRPGDKLPPEAELAHQFGVSRPTVREALKVLEALNVLKSSTGPRGGTFVKELDPLGAAEHLKESLALLLDVNGLTLEELYETREAIEIRTVRLAAQRRTDADLEALSRIIEEDNLKDSDSIVSDISFHRAIAEASKSRMLSLFMNSTHMIVRSLAERYIMPEAKQTSQRQHQGIYQAILHQEESLAEERMREHMRFASEVYRRAIPDGVASKDEGQPHGASERS
jgi:GntR family transcriptional regulator, transcriptional repressor for pyruvate dehydrogenase complex